MIQERTHCTLSKKKIPRDKKVLSTEDEYLLLQRTDKQTDDNLISKQKSNRANITDKGRYHFERFFGLSDRCKAKTS